MVQSVWQGCALSLAAQSQQSAAPPIDADTAMSAMQLALEATELAATGAAISENANASSKEMRISIQEPMLRVGVKCKIGSP